MATGLNLITREAVDGALRLFAELGRDAFLNRFGFGKARDYLVQDPLTGNWADSKAIIGAAYGLRFPERGPLNARDFSGGQAHIVRLLRELGYEVISTSEAESEIDADNRSWSHAEVEIVVADYLEMLALELAGQNYNKAARRRGLIPLLNRRSDASIEFKRRNISSVLTELGYPAIRGYLPAHNKQAILVEAVERQLEQSRTLDDLARSSIDMPAVAVESGNFDNALVPAPVRRERQLREPSPTQFRAAKRDYLEREARNSSLGKAGELFILGYEQRRLVAAGAGQLADKVRHVAVEEGDGLGYDIRSFHHDGTERFIEVKTTAFGELTPFFVTATELRFARQEPSRFCLSRLFDFRASPRFFELSGPIENHCSLDPVSYRAALH